MSGGRARAKNSVRLVAGAITCYALIIRRHPPLIKKKVNTSVENRKRKPRSDALRNRDRLIEAAKDVLGNGGPEASLEAVARQAGVGIGTLYRHFPSREELFHAVFRKELELLVETVEGLADEPEPVAALRGWLHDYVALVETKRGMLGALSMVMAEESKQTYSELSERISTAINRMLHKAADVGHAREDVTAEELLQVVYALCYAREPGPGWRAQVLHLLDIFVEGLKR
ncbi:TetR/AcrR family transcriptional regulator [Paracoccus saliphilus]|uniref:TetR/AcrR family transcriptional regulator n=1 Tax=Paracoccus saliphilus TaxID=405559 RepID=A0ABY7SCQ4_9RHOB|nr:TetR/AcrR family transcriptional regulator [Paracoccus saliphilus]